MLFKDLGMTVSSETHGNRRRPQLEVEHGKADIIVASCLTTERSKVMLYPALPHIAISRKSPLIDYMAQIEASIACNRASLQISPFLHTPQEYFINMLACNSRFM